MKRDWRTPAERAPVIPSMLWHTEIEAPHIRAGQIRTSRAGIASLAANTVRNAECRLGRNHLHAHIVIMRDRLRH